ncbi:YfiR family protein [Geomesophilobacter sediminis]|uniref:YfiR family protein n=1 Tax=Geomesophilobacter sediminis TaxID=2798584 RepID=A0A8J7M367_9BACT|nr:YfiR family protein [Geomesophilobacter sediminis]MBJ6727797.1 YfiR family protein [Geomesophilobacter sediminis]
MPLRHPHIATRPGAGPRALCCGAFLLLLGALTLWGPPVRSCAAEGGSVREYQVKAAFIYNFMKFVEWPAGEGVGTPSTITFGILGKDPFGEALDQIKGKTAKGRRVVVVHFRRVEEVRDCDVLFIAESEKSRVVHILKGVQNARILTVSDLDGFCQAGGMISLVSAQSRIVFDINAGAANRARLRISSQLLKLARNVIE